MTYTPIPAGTTQWDVPVNAAFTDQDARIDSNASAINSINTALTNRVDYDVSDFGLISWTYDPAIPSGALAIASGVINMIKVKVTKTTTVSTLGVGVSTAGTVLTANSNKLGLYDVSGVKIGECPDQTTSWATTGWRRASLVSPVGVQPGYYYVAILANYSGGTLQLVRGSSLSATPVGELTNLNLTPDVARFSTFGTGLTALPSSITLSSRALSPTAWWVTLQ